MRVEEKVAKGLMAVAKDLVGEKKTAAKWKAEELAREWQIDEADAEQVLKLVKRPGSDNSADRTMEKINKLIGGFGVEAIRSEEAWDRFWTDIVAICVNMGDTYDLTVVYDVDEGKCIITTWGDWVEDAERRGIEVI
jgi:hypothetical protein